MTSQEIIDKLTELDIPTSVAQDQNNDPYTLLEKINYVLSKLDELIAREGTQVKVAGIVQKLIDFVDDPQDQITNLTDAVALNIEGIAHMNEIKQDKLSQTDLDNIAGLNDLQDKLDAKANQSEVTQLATAVENNATQISKKVTGDIFFLQGETKRISLNNYNSSIIYYGSQGVIKIYNSNGGLILQSNPNKYVKMACIFNLFGDTFANILYSDGTYEYKSGSSLNDYKRNIDFESCYGQSIKINEV